MIDNTSTISVLLTACINPGPGRVDRADPERRLLDYSSGLKWWLLLNDQRLANVVFIDNSGYSVDRLKRIADEYNPYRKSCEFLQTADNTCPAGIQYGYGELGMIDYALRNSTLLANSGYFIKATGRLTFPNISRLLSRVPQRFDFVVETRDFKFGSNVRRFVTTQIAIFATQYYREQMLGIRGQMKAGSLDSIEKLLYQKLMPSLGNPRCILRFPKRAMGSKEGGYE